MMIKRVQISEQDPKAYKAMFGMEAYLGTTEIKGALADIIKIRASQINNCAYCIEMHCEEALKHGENQKRLFAIAAWKESPLFTDKERAAFAMTEEITVISQKGLTDATYLEASKYFSELEIAQLIMLIGVINMWNRIAVSTQLMHE